MTSEKLSTEIAVLERKSKEAKNATVKKLLDKKIATLREELKKEVDAIGKLSKAKKKVREMTQADFNEYIKMLSKKDGYSFLKSMTKDEIKRDIQRVAKPVGWRFRGNNVKKPTKKDVKDGEGVYFENRVNRSDVSRTVRLAKGGGVGEYESLTLKYDYPKYKRKPAATVYMKVDTSSPVKVGGLGEKGYRLVFKDGNRSDSVITERELEELKSGQTINYSYATVTISEKYAQGGGVGELPKSLQKRIDNLEGRLDITKEKALEAYRLHIDKGYGGSGIGYELFNAKNQKESTTFGDLAIDLGRFYSEKKYAQGGVADGDFGAEKAGERRSRKYSTIEIKSGGEYTRRNANQYGKAKGGRNYTENRDNRSDKRRWMEDGGSVNEGLFGEPHRLEGKQMFAKGGGTSFIGSELGDYELEKLQGKNSQKGVSIKEMSEILDRQFPDSFGFTLNDAKTNDDLRYLKPNPDNPYRGIKDDNLKLSFTAVHGLDFRVFQGGENTYFYFPLYGSDEKEYIGGFGFKDEGTVPKEYVTSFISFLCAVHGFPFKVSHNVY